MGYLDQYAELHSLQRSMSSSIADTIAAQYPEYETQSPQYPNPSTYSLTQEGYRKNEFVYTLIGKRAKAVSEPPIAFYEEDGDTKKEIANFGASGARKSIRDLIRRPNLAMSEVDFWAVTQIYMDTAGFSAWEIEFNNGGDPIGLWPMSPHYCSFMRGQGQPIRVIRYQPYGLPFQDVPIERVVLFQEFDPLYPLLKGLSRSAVAMRMIGVDNRATDFLSDFFRRGAVAAGLLTTEQALNDATAIAIQKRWQQAHGGVENWSQVAVLGQGTKYQTLSINFRDMAFDALDGRTEARLCGVFDIPPMLVGAKIGLAASTLANFEQARAAWYEESIMAIWRYLAARITTQLMPYYGATPKMVAAFNTKQVKALQEDRSKIWGDSISAAKQNLITRDEAREKMGYDPIDLEPVFVGVNIKGADSSIDITDPSHELDAKLNPDDQQEQAGDLTKLVEDAVAGAAAPGVGVAQTTATQAMPVQQPPTTTANAPAPATADQAAKALERRQYREFARARKREGKSTDGFRFRFLDEQERSVLTGETPQPAAVSAEMLIEQARALRASAERLMQAV